MFKCGETEDGKPHKDAAVCSRDAPPPQVCSCRDSGIDRLTNPLCLQYCLEKRSAHFSDPITYSSAFMMLAAHTLVALLQ